MNKETPDNATTIALLKQEILVLSETVHRLTEVRDKIEEEAERRYAGKWVEKRLEKLEVTGDARFAAKWVQRVMEAFISLCLMAVLGALVKIVVIDRPPLSGLIKISKIQTIARWFN